MHQQCENTDGEWCEVKPRTRTPRLTEKSTPVDLSFDKLSDIVRTVLHDEPGCKAAYIYGSRARGTNRPDSDADVIVFWNYNPNKGHLKGLRAEIESRLGFQIDFVSCRLTKKWVSHDDERDHAYFDNVIQDARMIVGENLSISFLIDRSVKMPKLSRH